MKILIPFRTVSTTLLFATITACGGGGGSSTGNPPPPPPSFALLSGEPGDKSPDVGREAPLTLTFSSAVDGATATATALRLTGPDGIVIPVTVSTLGAKVSIVPAAQALPGNTTYQLNVAATIAGTNGAKLAAAVSRSFTTVAQQWNGTSSQIGTLNYFTAGTAPLLANDGKGNTIAVWYTVSSPNTIYASRLDARAETWSAPVPIEVMGDFDAIGGVRLVSAPTGDVYLGWTEYRSSNRVFRLKRYRADLATWDAANVVSLVPAGINFDGAAMAADPTGKLHFLSQAYGFATAPGLFASSYDLTTATWSTPVRVDTSVNPYFRDYRIAVDGNGNAVAAWNENGSLKVARNDKTVGTWSAPFELDNSASSGLQIATSAHGNIALSWRHDYGSQGKPTAHGAMYDARAAGWRSVQRLDAGASIFGVNSPAVTIDSAGNATFAWFEGDAINGVRFDAASAQWSAPQTVLARADMLAEPQIGVDAAGNVVVTAVQDNLPIAAQFNAGSKQWRSAPMQEFVPGPSVFANSPALVVGASGTATAAWNFQSALSGQLRMEVRGNRFR